MFLLLSFTVATAAPQTLPAETEPAASTWRQKRLERKRKARHIDFEDPTNVVGEVIGPDIEIHIDRPVPAHPPLYTLRADFNDELERSAHTIK